MESIQAIILTPLPSSGQATGAYSLVLLTPCDNPVRCTTPDLIGHEKIEVQRMKSHAQLHPNSNQAET